MLQKIQNRRGGFTLVEIMIVVAIIALLASIAVPSALRARKRTQATKSLDICRQIDSAVDQWAIENNLQPGATVAGSDIAKFIKTGSKLQTELLTDAPTDALGRNITIPTVDNPPKISGTTVTDLADVVDSTTFWGIYK